jgi:uncharacterized iron-regulated membrane protein
MKRVRPVLFWIHLAAGVAAGAIILIMSATGAVLALKPQLLAAIDHDARTTLPSAADGMSPSPIDVLVANIRQAKPDAKVLTVAVQADPAAAAAITLEGGVVVYGDPRTGQLLGEGSRRAQAFFRATEDWHRWLGASPQGRATGRAITGACNLAFFIIAVTGPFLWWPRRWNWANLRAVLWFRRGATARARDFNWHNVIGIWCAPVLTILTITAVVMSYRWANDLLYRLAGSPPPAVAGDAAPRVPGPAPVPERLDALVARAREQVPTWRSISLRWPVRAGVPAVLTIVDARSWNAFARSQLTVDPATATVIRWEPYDRFSLGQKMRGWARFSHTGELAGLPGQVVAGLACAGAVVLVWTGTALAIRRLFAALAPVVRRRAASVAAASLER